MQKLTQESLKDANIMTAMPNMWPGMSALLPCAIYNISNKQFIYSLTKHWQEFDLLIFFFSLFIPPHFGNFLFSFSV